MESFSSSLLRSPCFLLDKSDKVSMFLNEACGSFRGYHAIYWIALLSIPFFLTYMLTYISAITAIRSKRIGKRVPTSPYWVPFVGHAFEFLFATSNLFVLARRSFPKGPLGVKLGIQKLIFITGSENIIKVWHSKVLQSREVSLFALNLFFGMPKSSMGIYMTDTSGISHEPHPSSNTAHKDRHHYHTRKTVTDFFNGPDLQHVTQNFEELLHVAILKLEIGQEWQEMSDLYAFVQYLLTGPTIETFCGPRILEKNPNFISQFWKFDSDTLWFMKRIPKFLIPSAWDNRAKLLASVKEWHTYAKTNYQNSDIDASGRDPYYGSPLFRWRQELLTKVDTFNTDTLASLDLGLLWTTSGNSVPSVFWMLVELIRHPEVLELCIGEIDNIMPTERIKTGNNIDIGLMCKNPVLQSVYAEVLRLYTSVLVLRSAVHEDFLLGNWHIPRDQVIAIDARTAHFDSSIWNSQAVSKHAAKVSVHDFCHHRFLRYADEDVMNNQDADTTSTKPYFSTKGLSGAWLPFGGGSRQCPAKQFAKQKIVLSFIKVISAFEIELLDERKCGSILPDLRYYGIGTLPPRGKVAFRIRRRA